MAFTRRNMFLVCVSGIAMMAGCTQQQIQTAVAGLTNAQTFASNIYPTLKGLEAAAEVSAAADPEVVAKIKEADIALDSTYAIFKSINTDNATAASLTKNFINAASAEFVLLNGITGLVPPDIATGVNIAMAVLSSYVSAYSTTPQAIVIPPVPTSLHEYSMKARTKLKLKL